MCIGISAIALQRGDRRLLYKNGINRHNKIREAFGIGDYRSEEQVNLEAHPGPCLTEIDGWTIHVDHDGAPPQWYQEERIEIESAFRDFFEAEIREMRETGVYDGELDLSGTTITSLGELRKCGYLNLSLTPITSLGGLRKCGYLCLACTPITSLGGLRECGNLDICCTPITSLGELQKCGDLLLTGTPITSLGGLQKCGDIDLSGTPITSLGELRECGNLDLRGTPITSLGDLRECGGLWLRGTKISIPQNLKHGEIYL
jgi:hypothetical protein